jgi:hypothetical protein
LAPLPTRSGMGFGPCTTNVREARMVARPTHVERKVPDGGYDGKDLVLCDELGGTIRRGGSPRCFARTRTLRAPPGALRRDGCRSVAATIADKPLTNVAI